MIPLTHEAVQARRLELATVEEQIRALGRRKSVLRAEILSGYAAPAKGAPAEQLPLAETATAAPAQAPEAAKPATATATATPLRDRVRAALGAAKGRRSAKVLATLLGESEEDVADELEGLELAREVIGKNTSGKAGRAYELRDRWEAKRGKGRDTKPEKASKKPLWKPGYKPGIVPSLTPEGNRRALEMIAAAPGKKMLTSVVRAALDLPDDCCTPRGCYYQGSQAGGDWWGIRDDGAAKPTKPPGKAPAKKAKAAAKGKKVEGTRSRTRTVAEDIEAVLREWGSWLDVAHLEAKVREAMPLTLGPSTREWEETLAALLEAKKLERKYEYGRALFRLATPASEAKPSKPKPKKASKAAPKAPSPPPPTLPVKDALAKMLEDFSIDQWAQARAEVCEKIAQKKGASVAVGPLLLSLTCESIQLGPVLELLDAAGAVTVGYRGKTPAVVTPGAKVGDEEIAADLQALSRRYIRDLVDDRHGPPTASELAESLGLPAALIDSVLIELRAAQELLCDREGRWSVRSPKASAASRTVPLFDDVEPVPAVDGLEPEGDES